MRQCDSGPLGPPTPRQCRKRDILGARADSPLSGSDSMQPHKLSGTAISAGMKAGCHRNALRRLFIVLPRYANLNRYSISQVSKWSRFDGSAHFLIVRQLFDQKSEQLDFAVAEERRLGSSVARGRGEIRSSGFFATQSPMANTLHPRPRMLWPLCSSYSSRVVRRERKFEYLLLEK